MSALLQEMSDKALKLNIPLSVQLDLTYRCNERCVHCYLDHELGNLQSGTLTDSQPGRFKTSLESSTILRSTTSLFGAFMQLIPYTKRNERGSISTTWVRI
jgi:MoaA/NifB/PqqE/SkfB family radical SAM enzyme